MTPLLLHELHQRRWQARFVEINGAEAVDHYGDVLAEHGALRHTAGVLDLSFRSRLCLTGEDRQRFLNGQVTNNVKDLKPGEGCYAALVTAKGKMEADLNIYCLAAELLLDAEPGLASRVTQRLEKFIIADDVQVTDIASSHGLLTVQGPRAQDVLDGLGLAFGPMPPSFHIASAEDADLGEIYCSRQSRGSQTGFDLFIPAAGLAKAAEKLVALAEARGGRACGWQALELLRVEAGIPRYGLDMDETNLPPEAGLEERAISYSKGCYIGQEVIARIRTYGQAAKNLRGLLLPDDLPALPRRGDKLFSGDKEAGYVTSAIASPSFQRNLALGYVRREHPPGTSLRLASATGDYTVHTVPLPFDGEKLGHPDNSKTS